MIEIELPISKSIANRLLILGRDTVSGISAFDLPHDVVVMRNALNSSNYEIDIEDCGTAMRFLTAYYAALPEEHILTGSERMLQRPIGDLVDALRQIGANIEYLGADGFPPLLIRGQMLSGGDVAIRGNISSQFISALLLVSPLTKYGITIHLVPPIVSSRYIKMTECIIANPDYPLESDWSAAAFWYEYVAVSQCKQKILLKGLKMDSIQADKVVVDLFKLLGVETDLNDDGIELYSSGKIVDKLKWDFTDCPDLYPVAVATCFALKIDTEFSGISNLKYKESDRIKVLNEAFRNITNGDCLLNEYNDHRVAMALIMLRAKYDNIQLSNPMCIAKSYPHFIEQTNQLWLF